MKGADPPPSIGKAVNHDVAARWDAACGRAIDIPLVRIRDVQSAVVVAVLLMKIDPIKAFRRSLIAFLLLRPDRRAAQRHAISFERRPVAQESQAPDRLFNEDAVGGAVRGQGMQIQMGTNQNADGPEAAKKKDQQQHFQN